MKKRFLKIAAATCTAAMVFASGAAFAGTADTATQRTIGSFSRLDCMEELMSALHVEMPIDIEKCISDIEKFFPEFGGNQDGDDTTDNPEQDGPQLPEQGKPDTPQQPEQKPEKPDTPEQPDTDTDNDTETDEESNNNQNNGGSMIGSSYAKQVADIVNDERAEAGLSELSYNSELAKVAQAKAEDMRDKGYFDHTSPTYGTPFEMMEEFGIKYTAAGENIAKGQKSPESVMTAWMNSSGHRANILNGKYEQIGVGYCTDSNGTTYWVQMFIK